jgi:hypothetical protein
MAPNFEGDVLREAAADRRYLERAPLPWSFSLPWSLMAIAQLTLSGNRSRATLRTGVGSTRGLEDG